MKFVNECWAMVPARSGSKTIKNKNIKIIKGSGVDTIFFKKGHQKKNI